jgi:hypothetical protein
MVLFTIAGVLLWTSANQNRERGANRVEKVNLELTNPTRSMFLGRTWPIRGE